MKSTAHIARVCVTFDFIGILPIGDYADPEKAVKERFKFFNPEIVGFAEQNRSMAIKVTPVDAPELNVK